MAMLCCQRAGPQWRALPEVEILGVKECEQSGVAAGGLHAMQMEPSHLDRER